MRKNEFKDMGRKELETLIAELRSALHGMEVKISVGQLKGVRAVRQTKKQIARMLTQLSALTE